MTVNKFGTHISKKHLKYKRNFIFSPLKTRQHIDAKNLRILNVARPISSTDAVNKSYSDALAVYYTNLKNWPGNFINGNKKRLANFAPPIDSYDVVTKDFLLATALSLKQHTYDGNNKRITNVASPISANDVVTLDYFTKTLQLMNVK